MNASCNRALTLPRLTLAFLIILAVYLFRDSWIPADSPYSIHAPVPQPDVQQSDTTAEKTSDSVKKPQDDDCRSMPGADNVLILLKTGATEIYEKLPTHFMTLFKCAPHYMIFSDLAQDYADFPIRDAIAPVSKQFREQHEDFTLYRKLQQYQREGQDTSKLKGGEGWNLDKWKFLPLLFEAFESAPPNIDWFFMMEADTSVSWTNLLQWLNTMDASDPIYAGSQNVIGGTEFAHGGSGVLLSRQAAKQLQETREQEGKEKYNKRWEETTSSSCCGDEVLARALLEADVPMKPAWPLIQGETVATVDFTKNHWCTPAITWHHVTPLEIDALWQFQADWTEDHGWDTPYLFRDIFDHFIDSHITFNRHAWNNLSQDRKLVARSIASDDDIDISRLSQLEQKAVESESGCEAACARDLHRKCVQWMFSPGRCYLGQVVRFGKTDEREGESWISGWNSQRVAKHKAQLGTCKKVDWKDGES